MLYFIFLRHATEDTGLTYCQYVRNVKVLQVFMTGSTWVSWLSLLQPYIGSSLTSPTKGRSKKIYSILLS